MDFINLSKVAYSDQLVLTTAQLAEFYGCTTNSIKVNFHVNKDHFIEGKHYFKLEGEELKNFKRLVSQANMPVNKFSAWLNLWTKRGAALHAKMLSTDRAWEVYELLEDAYFDAQEKSEPAQNAQTKSETNQDSESKISVQPQPQNTQPQFQPQIKNQLDQNLRIACALKDIEASLKVAKKIFKYPKANLLISCKEAAEKCYSVDLSAFDILISADSDELIFTPVEN